uniref:Fimbrial assembly family protein n=1 Tax=Thermodesulfobacterium geofontis TaxID=1295609 RepID=A0A7C4NZE1_9BACT
MIVVYLQKEGVNFYKIKNGKIIEVSPESLRFAKFFSKKILVISKELLFYTRKNYPPIPLAKLKKAIQLEIPELFPISNLDYTIKIFETTEKGKIVDIWAWSKDEYKRISEILPFQYVIPEDLLFVDEEQALKIFCSNGIYHLIASSKGKFLGTLSLANLTKKDIELFLAGLTLAGPTSYKEEVKKIIIYGDILKDVNFETEVVRIPAPPYPICLEGIPKINLNEFKVRRVFPLKMAFFLKVPLYALIGYSVFLYFTAKNYDATLKDLKTKISELDRKIASLENKEGAPKDFSALISEVNKKISETVSPLTVMNELAQRIPPGCTVNRFVLNEKKLELAMTYEDPLEVIELLSTSKMIKSVKLEGTPVKKTGTRLYDFRLTLELEGD